MKRPSDFTDSRRLILTGLRHSLVRVNAPCFPLILLIDSIVSVDYARITRKQLSVKLTLLAVFHISHQLSFGMSQQLVP